MFGCLIGNGFSISFNERLAVSHLTDELVAAFSELSGGQAEQALASFAEAAGGGPATDFEALLGPLDATSIALLSIRSFLEESSEVQAPISAALQESARFLKRLHRVGFGTTLEVIARHSRAEQGEGFQTVIVPTCTAISGLADLDDRGYITVGTLNYDGLLHAGFLATVGSAALTDLAWGGQPQSQTPDGVAYLHAWPLRTEDDIPFRRVELLNLHGSLMWLRTPDGDRAWKFGLDRLRNLDYWGLVKRGGAVLEPTVVLTNQKANAILGWPFSLAYTIFEDRLRMCDRFLIAGYSFGDEPVNRALWRVFRMQRHEGVGPPFVLVINRSSDEEASRTDIARTLGLDPASVLVDGRGIPNAIGGPLWNAWVA